VIFRAFGGASPWEIYLVGDKRQNIANEKNEYKNKQPGILLLTELWQN